MKIPDYSSFMKAVATEGSDPQVAFTALYELTRDVVGVKLFTITTLDGRTGMAGRVYSNMPETYSISGTKPANETDWSRQVIKHKRTFVANDIEGIAAVFDDHELIKSLGCESVINVPIVICGRVLGTINCLHVAGFYTEDKVEAAEMLKLPGAVCLLFNELKAGQA